jgi:hypothetical protein
MRAISQRHQTDAAVVRQAADIVSAAIRETLLAALQGATACGCRRCRADATRTYEWAVAMVVVDTSGYGYGR